MTTSHYAEGVERRLCGQSSLRIGPSVDAEAVEELKAGDPFLMLDESPGWAWGYGGADRRVGYVPSGALTRQ